MQSIVTEQYGPWALVTGASSGIGKEFAEQLATAGLNIVLVARGKAVLDKVAQELETRHEVKTMTVAVDLG